MKIISLNILMLFWSVAGHPQFNYFNDIYHLGNPSVWSASGNLCEADDGYIICGKTGSDIGIIKLNEFGDQIWSKTWGDTVASWYFGYPGSIESINDGYFIAGSKNYFSPLRQVGLLLRFNTDWDTLWTKEYNMNLDEILDTATLIQQMDLCDNGNLILVGSVANPGIGSSVLLIRSDSVGSVQWIKTYSYSNSSSTDGYSVIQTSDYGFAMGGFWWISGSSSATGDPIIIKTDSLGNQEWVINLGGSYEDNRAMLCKSHDNNILMGTAITDYETGGTRYATINVVKLDNSGNIIWDKKYGESIISNYVSNIRCLDDGSIICVGSSRSEVPWHSGWILKLNAEGDSLWFREYYILSGEHTYNQLRDIIPSSDTGLVACGFVTPTLPDTGIQSAWVIKLDSIGCEWAGCDTTVGIKETGGKGEEVKRRELEIWPNPAKEVLNVKCLVLSEFGELEFVIYDVFGRAVSGAIIKQVSAFAGTGWQVDVSTLPPGIYFVSVLEKGRRIAGAKFVNAGH